MTNWTEQLYGLLPSVYQIRDAAEGEPLRQLLAVIGEQVQIVEQDIAELYDNWFIETCDPWLVPYLGDLMGHRSGANAPLPYDAAIARNPLIKRFLHPRREIANLVQRRRRKGTLSVLEDVANDVTRWPARAVEFSRLVHFFQHARHPQPKMGRAACARASDSTARLNTPFDRMAHTVDVRAISSSAPEGWYHPRKVGLFVWRRNAYSATNITPCAICTAVDKHIQAYTFNRLGLRQALVVSPRQEVDELSIAAEQNLPVPLFRHLLADKRTHIASSAFYGFDDDQPRSLAIEVRWKDSDDWTLVPGRHIHVCNLADENRWSVMAHGLPDFHAAVDPECGVFFFKHCQRPCAVRATYHYSSCTELGGGEYPRPLSNKVDRVTIRVRLPESCQQGKPENLFQAICRAFQDTDCGPCGTKLENPLQCCNPDKTKTDCSDCTCWKVVSDLCVEILGSDNFQIPANESLLIVSNATLEIRAASGSWPLIHICSTNCAPCGNPWQVRLGRQSGLVLDGLQICGATMHLEDLPIEDDQIPPQPRLCGGPNPCAEISAQAASTAFRPLKPARVIIRHATFVPGGRAVAVSCPCQPSHASIAIRLTDAQITIIKSIVGTLNVEHPECRPAQADREGSSTCPQDALALRVFDSVLDAASGRMALTGECCWPAHVDLSIERSTVLGDICLQQITRAEDSLFGGIVHVQRRGLGYMRFCYVPTHWQSLPKLRDQECGQMAEQMRCNWAKWLDLTPDYTSALVATNCCSLFRTPIRFKCLDGIAHRTDRETGTCCGDCKSSPTAMDPAALVLELPKFVSTSYGDPGYCELSLDCPPAIRQGAEDESELGVFHDLFNPQRGAALEARLQEYTPAEMESAVIYADDLHPASFGRDTCKSSYSRRG
jgi:hypothetical protein